MNIQGLKMVSGESQDCRIESEYANLSTEELWSLVDDDKLHLSLKESMILELASRDFDRTLDFCEQYVSSGNIEKWFIAVHALASIQESQSIERLLSIYIKEPIHKRRILMEILGQSITIEYVRPFSIIIQSFIRTNRFDARSWNWIGKQALENVCKRFGLSVNDYTNPTCDI